MIMNDFRDLPDKGMKLATFVEEVSDGQVLVRWWVGARNHGSLKINTPKNSENAVVIGELTAIGYLLFKERVFNRDAVSGRGIYLYVSKGATKKIAKRKSRMRNSVDMEPISVIV